MSAAYGNCSACDLPVHKQNSKVKCVTPSCGLWSHKACLGDALACGVCGSPPPPSSVGLGMDREELGSKIDLLKQSIMELKTSFDSKLTILDSRLMAIEHEIGEV